MLRSRSSLHELPGIASYSHNPITNPMAKNMQNPYIKRELLRAREKIQSKQHLEQSKLKFYGVQSL